MEHGDTVHATGTIHRRRRGEDAACDRRDPARPVDLFLAKFLALEATVERERGACALFALVAREGAWPEWDLVVAADWVGDDPWTARRYLARRSMGWFAADELARVGPYVALNPSDDFARALLARLPPHEPLHPLPRMVVGEVEIRRAVVIHSSRAA